MKKLLALFTFVLLVGSANGQWVVQSFDNAVGPFFSDPAQMGSNFYASGSDFGPKMDLFNDPDHIEGTGSIRIEYKCVASEGWGGYTVRTTPRFDNYIDLSAGTELRLWYKVVKPVTQTTQGAYQMEFKMGDYNEENQRDLWLSVLDLDMADASGQWKQITIPLVLDPNGTDGFRNQFADGDGEIQFDKIKSFEITTVWLGAGDAANPPIMEGTILWDKLELVGNRYTPIFTFDEPASGWNLDWMEWAGNDKGAIAVSNETTDKVEGTGSLKINYTLSAPYGWGGFLSIDKDVAKPDKFEERTALVLYVKNVQPIVADANRAFLRIFIMENSDGTNEEWIIDAGLDLSQPFDWTRVYMPLVQKPMGVNDRFPPKDGFALKNNAGNKVLDPAAITKIRIEIFGRGTEDGFAAPLKGTGTLLLDVMQQSGFQFADKEAPAAPQGFTIIPQLYSNLITWTDVPGELQERYNVYYSTSPITDLTAPGVVQLGGAVAENTQVVEHLLRSPKNAQQQTFYYAINCVDKAGNIGPIATVGPFTNTSKGIPTVSLKVPNFKADGDLNEWSAIQPFTIKVSDGTAYLAPNDIVDNDDDLSGSCYVAIDKDYLYVAYDITDNVVYDDNSYYPNDTWALDATELFIGLYNLTFSHGRDYLRGATPDYHLRFNKQKARSDHWETEADELLLPGPNYIWADKFPSGYIIEAKIPLVDLATKRDANVANPVTDVIYVKEGYKVPFDWGVFDNDGANKPEKWQNREARAFWSPFNKDAGYYDVRLWMYTWIGDTDQITTDVEETVPTEYSLSQNYPNPFNPTTQIAYSLKQAGMVSLKVYDVLGRVVADLVNKHQDAGSYTVNFDASRLATGIYFYKLESGSFTSVKKMMLVK